MMCCALEQDGVANLDYGDSSQSFHVLHHTCLILYQLGKYSFGIGFSSVSWVQKMFMTHQRSPVYNNWMLLIPLMNGLASVLL